MRKPEEIQQDILLLMNELFQAQEEEKKIMRGELDYFRDSINQLDKKNRKIARILMEDED